MSGAKGAKWLKLNLTGVAHYMFNNRPAAPDVEFNKPAMYKTEVEITEDSELRVSGMPKIFKGITEIKEVLSSLKVATTDFHGTTKEGVSWERNNIVKFKANVIDPEDAVKNKPITVDANGDSMGDGSPLIGNGSFVEVRGSLPDYRVTPPPAGRRPMLPKFEGVQVISLVEYIKPDNGAFQKREGYTVGSKPTAVVVGHAKSDHQDDDDGEDDAFAGLERPTDLEPATKTTETRVKKRA